MQWQTIVALCVMVPVILLPVFFTFFIRTDGFNKFFKNSFLQKIARAMAPDVH